MAEHTVSLPNDTQRVRARPAGSAATHVALTTALLLAAFAGLSPSQANNAGENGGWQFQTPTDQATLANVQDMIQKKRSGAYGPTSYYSTNNITTTTSTVGHQTNCLVSATSTGNSGSASSVASSPSTSGASAASLANSNTNASQPGYNGGTSSLSGTQSNLGTLGSNVNGSTTATAQGGNYQALNSTQGNTAGQTSAIKGSTACAYGALN